MTTPSGHRLDCGPSELLTAQTINLTTDPVTGPRTTPALPDLLTDD